MNSLDILSSLSYIQNMFLSVSFYAFIDMISLVLLMRFIDKNSKSNKFVELIIKVVMYSTLFSLLLTLVIFIINTYLSLLKSYANTEPKDSFTKLILDNTGSILTCITIPVSVIGTLMAKPIGQAISRLNSIIIDIMNDKIDIMNDKEDATSRLGNFFHKIMNSFGGFIIIVVVILLLDYLLYNLSTTP